MVRVQVVRVNSGMAYRAHAVGARNTLLVLDSVWPQNLAYWQDLGQYVCFLREVPSSRLVVVLFGDEYHQAPLFVLMHAKVPYVGTQTHECRHTDT